MTTPHDLENLDMSESAPERPDYFDPSLYPDESLPTGRHYLDGGAFIFDQPETIPAVWGAGNDVLWAEGEALIVYGGSGVGKTTIAGQLVRALVLGDSDVLGQPVAPAAGNVLYLAMDRPRQAARSLSRQFHPAQRDAVSRRLKVWPGPPPEDMADRTELLRQMCREARASHVVVDSLKDAAMGLSDDRVGAGWNRARQGALVDGVQVLELHHQIKARADSPKGIDAVYGSTWITTGAGSVVHLDGAPGDAVVKFRHLKQPADEVGPFDVLHDARTGLSTVVNDADPLTIVRARGQITVNDLAGVMFATDAPSRNEVEKAHRKLDGLARSKQLEKTPQTAQSGAAMATVYTIPDSG
ncbi:replicative DNA helicase [Micrococcus cohnii]|uniref:Replicative DNA helicase n=1 Tax=Micrococcus cohnii TaxID=993416 RepID=A0A7W7GPB6_9MICC|nr:replicative DNA helicase [Micrococcus cohnii]